MLNRNNNEIAQDEDKIVYRKHPDGTPCYAKDPKDCPIISQHMKADEADDLNDTGIDDAAYLEAVKNGDMETCAKMVHEAVKRAMPDTKVVGDDGKPMVVYHGTKDRFNVFSGGDENNSSWFAEKIGYAKEYAGDPEDGNVDAWVKHCFLNVKNPFDMRDGENVVDGYAEISMTRHDGGEASETEILKIARLLGTTSEDVRRRFDNRQIWEITQSREFAERLRSLGFDGIKFVECGDPTWAVFDSNQIKSADPITYDDDGNVIPLGKRFDFTNPDIRY